LAFASLRIYETRLTIAFRVDVPLADIDRKIGILWTPRGFAVLLPRGPIFIEAWLSKSGRDIA